MKAGGSGSTVDWPYWMDAETAAHYCGFVTNKHPREAFRQWAAARGVVPEGNAGRPRWSRTQLDDAIRVAFIADRQAS